MYVCMLAYLLPAVGDRDAHDAMCVRPATARCYIFRKRQVADC